MSSPFISKIYIKLIIEKYTIIKLKTDKITIEFVRKVQSCEV